MNLSNCVKEYKKAGFDNDQILKICLGHLLDLTDEQVKSYTNHLLTPEQMEQVLLGYKNIKDDQIESDDIRELFPIEVYEIILKEESKKLTEEQVRSYIDPELSDKKMELICRAYLSKKLTDTQVRSLIDPKLTLEEMRDKRIALEKENERNGDKK